MALTKKLQSTHKSICDDTIIINNSAHILVIASLISNISMTPLNPWTDYTGSV